jgi:hypothetical protein
MPVKVATIYYSATRIAHGLASPRLTGSPSVRQGPAAALQQLALGGVVGAGDR